MLNNSKFTDAARLAPCSENDSYPHKSPVDHLHRGFFFAQRQAG